MASYVYIISNQYHTVLYTGVTSNLEKRLSEHRLGLHEESFSKRYNLTDLLWYKAYDDIEAAILEEKRLKGGSRKAKENLIKEINPEWKNLPLG